MNRHLSMATVFVAGLLSASTAAQQPDDTELRAIGIGVSDLARSEAFYASVLGMQRVREYKLEALDEIVMALPGHATPVVVLMHWHDGKARALSEDNVKLVFNVRDAAAVIDRIRSAGGRIDREATPIEVLNGQIVGLGRDPDGYVIELLQR